MAVAAKVAARLKRKARVRKRVSGTPARPRLSVYRSLDHIYAQIIDDLHGRTLVSASTLSPELRDRLKGKKKVEQAKLVGELVAERARAAGITKVVFDRDGFLYHGRVAAVAEGAREKGLEF